MSSRPATFFMWSTGNYGAGVNPWNGQPSSVLPLLNYFLPDAALPADELNYVLESNGNAANTILNHLGQIDGLNWGAVIGLTAGFAIANSWAWDSYQGRWLLTCDNSGTTKAAVLQTFDNGKTFTQLGADLSSGYIGAEIICPPSGVVVNLSRSGGNVKSAVLTPATSTWAETSGTALQSSSSVILAATYFDSQYVYCEVFNGSSTFIPHYSSDGVTWHASGSTMPGGYTNAAGFLARSQSPTLLSVFPNVATTPTVYLTTTDGQTWTQQTLPALLTGEAVVGAGYDSSNGLYYYCASSSTAARIFASASGTGSWSVVGSLAYPIGSLAVSGSQLVCTATIASKVRTLVSINQGTTWGYSGATEYASGTGVTLYAGGANFLLATFNSTYAFAFSLHVGKGATVT